MSLLALLDVGPLELLVITVAAIILFGGDLPDIARRAGQFLGRLRSAAGELTRQLDPPPDLLQLPEPDTKMHGPPPPPATSPAPTQPSLSPPPTSPAPAPPLASAPPPASPSDPTPPAK